MIAELLRWWLHAWLDLGAPVRHELLGLIPPQALDVTFWDRLTGEFRAAAGSAGEWLFELLTEPYVVFPAIWALISAMGVTVRTGTTGLLFTLGRARQEIPPGFRLLIPFMQVVRILPTQERTLDLPVQKVTTFDGLVYEVDVNLVYRIADMRKALIEVDDLGRGMLQMLGLSVQEVLRAAERSSLKVSEDLDQQLGQAMEWRMAPWGVVVVRAGFTSIRPSPKTLRLTQLGMRTAQRRDSLRGIEDGGVERGTALPMLGAPLRYERRARRALRAEYERDRQRRQRRITKRVLAKSNIQSSRLRQAVMRRALRARSDQG